MTRQPEAPPPRRESQGWDELTEREREVMSDVSSPASFLPFLSASSHLSSLLSSSGCVSLSGRARRRRWEEGSLEWQLSLLQEVD